MFVMEGSTEKLREKRRQEFYDSYIYSLVAEAKRLQLSKEDINTMIERGFEE